MATARVNLSSRDIHFMRQALRLAKRGFGQTSPNPMVGALIVKNGEVIGRGWHHRAGEPHAEIEALRNAKARKQRITGATLYVTLEPCCTHGRTPPCTEAIIAAGVRRVVVAATDPNPKHAGRGYRILEKAGIKVSYGILAEESNRLNEAFNHWIVEGTPFVMVKAAMTLDGKIATASGESKWITGEKARAYGMKLRQGTDAILTGVTTVLADDPSLTFRLPGKMSPSPGKKLRRIILDSRARTPLHSKAVSDGMKEMTTVIVSRSAPEKRVRALRRLVNVWEAPGVDGRVDLRWLLSRLGQENVTSLLVEGGGEVNASFLLDGLAQRIAFFYAPKVLGGRDAIKAVAGDGAESISDVLKLRDLEWRQLGADLLLTARVD